MTETHLEYLADRIRPQTVSNLLLWLIAGHEPVDADSRSPQADRG